ncbi:hypothetical protein QE152_g29889 [Popillia japonica]|uniref:Integrase zinc-binding domain-containing protein n=1 Tax=Popillia japonica TaxID=7064 RepID=A0AAW1JGI2_POPJA
MKTKKTKKSFAEENAFRLGAGGGSNEKFNINEIDMGIKDIIGQQLTGNALELDDDCMQEKIKITTTASRKRISSTTASPYQRPLNPSSSTNTTMIAPQATQRFHWLSIRADIIEYIRDCRLCTAFKRGRIQPAAPLRPLTSKQHTLSILDDGLAPPHPR